MSLGRKSDGISVTGNILDVRNWLNVRCSNFEQFESAALNELDCQQAGKQIATKLVDFEIRLMNGTRFLSFSVIVELAEKR